MALIQRVRVTWSGFTGAPGVSTFYFTSAAAGLTKLHSFFAAIADMVPAGLTWTFPASGDVVNEENGVVESGWAAAAPAPVASIQPGTYSARAGACVTWQTGTVVGRRRVRGRTFIVPLRTAEYDNDGTLTPTCLGTIGPAASALVSPGEPLLIWHRPNAAHVGGIAVAATAAVLHDRTAILTSRMT